MVLPDASKLPIPLSAVRERHESFQFEKLPSDDDDKDVTMFQAMLEWKDFHLFLVTSLGLVALNGFIAIYFSAHI